MIVLVDGVETKGPALPASDSTIIRGDGCFETMRIYDSRAFELDAHLQRLDGSAAMLRIPVPDRTNLISWIEKAASHQEEGAVRIILTRGAAIPGSSEPPRCVVLSHPLPHIPAEVSLLPVVAPWHSAGESWDLVGAKTTSYAPNMTATRVAREHGYEDALLMSRKELVLEGPTFSIAWARNGVLETPALDLSILNSITRRIGTDIAREAGIDVVEGSYGLDHLCTADEVMALSTIKQVLPVTRIGDKMFSPGQVTKLIAKDYEERVAAQGN